MLAELVYVVTSDQFRLDGSLHVQSIATKAAARVDAMICLHGASSNFYSSSLLAGLTPPLLEAGIAVVRVNTRGHDLVYTASTASGTCFHGGAYEQVSDCIHDVHAWIEFLAERGYGRIGLLGHSLGAIKALYAQARDPHPLVRHVVAISPPRLSYSFLRETVHGAGLFADCQTARDHIDAGNGLALMQIDFPLPQLITARTLLDKYGPDENYNILRFLADVPGGVLVTYGSLEVAENAAFAGMPDAVKKILHKAPANRVATIRDANHIYTGVQGELADEIVRWLTAGNG